MTETTKYISEYGEHWRVRIRTSEGRKVKCFSFNKWGGKAAAFLLALKWRNQTLDKYGLRDRLKYDKSPDLFTDGSKIHPIIGVYETQSNLNFNWCASFQRNHVVKKTHFSINKYGNEAAFLMACQVRFKNSGKLIVINQDAMPCLPNVPFKIHRLKEA